MVRKCNPPFTWPSMTTCSSIQSLDPSELTSTFLDGYISIRSFPVCHGATPSHHLVVIQSSSSRHPMHHFSLEKKHDLGIPHGKETPPKNGPYRCPPAPSSFSGSERFPHAQYLDEPPKSCRWGCRMNQKVPKKKLGRCWDITWYNP